MARSHLFGRILSRALRSPTVQRTARRAGRSLARRISDRTRGVDPGASRGGGRRGTSSRTAPRGGSGGPRGTGGTGPLDVGVHRVLEDRLPAVALTLQYAPHADQDADPGEVVWAWVAFEEDRSRGKDRPVLVLALEDASVGGSDGSGPVYVALMLTSRDRGHGQHTDEYGASWVDIGTGDWDSRRRPSEVRVDRLLRIPRDAVRREGGRLDRDRFEKVADATRRVHGWD